MQHKVLHLFTQRESLFVGIALGFVLFAVESFGYLYSNLGTLTLAKLIYDGEEKAVQSDSRLSVASWYYHKATQWLPENVRIQENMGKIWWAIGDNERALAVWQVQINKKIPTVLTSYFSGLSYFQLEEWSSATKVWANGTVSADAIVGLRHKFQDNEKQLAKLAEVSTRLAVADIQNLAQAARDYETWGLRKPAALLWSQFAQYQTSESADWWFANGQAAYLDERLDEAIQTFSEGWSRWPKDSRFPQGWLLTLAYTGRVSEAIVIGQRWATQSPANTTPYMLVGEMYHSQNDLANAIKWWTQALALAPNNSLVLFRLGQTAYATHNYFLAQKYYQTAIQADPSLSEAYFGLGEVYAASGELDDAIALAEQAVHLYQYGGCPWTWYGQIASWYQSLGRPELAISAYRKAIACNSDYIEGHKAINELEQQAEP